MIKNYKSRIFNHLPDFIGGVLGLLAPWMILGYWTRWLFFPEIQKYIFLLVFSFFSCILFIQILRLIWRKINPETISIKNIILLFAVFGICLFTSYELRIKLPFSLSNPFRIHELSIYRSPDDNLSGHPTSQISFKLFTAYGNPVYIPSLHSNGGWESTGNEIFSIASDAIPLQFRFPENRINSRFSLLLFKTPYSGKAVLIVADQTIPLNFFASENMTETVKIFLSSDGKIPRNLLLIDLLLQAIYFSILTIFCFVLFSALYEWLEGISFRILAQLTHSFILRAPILVRKYAKYILSILIILGVIAYLVRPSILLFIFDCILVGLFSVFITSLFNLDNLLAYFISLAFLAYSNLVLTIEILGGLALLNSTNIIFLHIFFAFGAWLLWVRKGKTNLLGPITKFDLVLIYGNLINSINELKNVAILFLATLISHTITFLKVLLVPQNVDDILTAYLPRVGYWLQNQSIYPWETSTYNLSQIVYPLNGQVPLVWSASLLHSNVLCGFLQWVFLPIGFLSIYGISRLYNFKRWQALLGALLFSLLPNVIIQSSTAMTDLLIACLLIAAIYLFMCGLRENNKSYLILSSIGMGLTLGVKQTVIFLLPGLAIFLFFFYLDLKKESSRNLILWLFSSIANSLLLGSFIYITNFIIFGNLGGPPDIILKNFSRVDEFSNIIKVLQGTGINLYKLVISSFFDNFFVSTLRPIFEFFDRLIPQSSPYKYLFPINTYPFGFAWIGQVGFVLFCATCISLIKRTFTEKKWAYMGIVALVLPYTFIFLITKDSVAAMSRYLLLVVIFVFPFVPYIIKEKFVQRFVIVLSIFLAGMTLVHEGFKPLIGENAIWNTSFAEKESIRFISLRPILSEINALVPEEATLGIILPNKFPQALLFTPDFSRRIIQIAPIPIAIEMVDLRTEGIEYLLIEKEIIESGLSLSPSLKQISSSTGNQVLFFVP